MDFMQQCRSNAQAPSVFNGNAQGPLKHILGEPGHVRRGNHIMSQGKGMPGGQRLLCEHVQASQ